MKIKLYVDRLNASKDFGEFKKKYPDSFMIAGFFIMDLEQGNNLNQIDYYIPSQKKIAAFTLNRGVDVQILDTMNNLVPEQLEMKTNIDLEALPGILRDEMKNRSMTEDIKKMIAIIQSIDGKKVWNINCILSGMEVLKAHVDDDSQTILKMEKASLMDYVKKIPAAELKKMAGMKMPAGAVGEDGEVEGGEDEEEGKTAKKSSKEEVKEKLKKLEELESEIEKEKKEFEEELKEAPAKGKKAKVSKKK